MKKVVYILIFAFITVLANRAYAEISATSLPTGRAENGEFVIPESLALTCNVKLSDKGASMKMEDCFRRALKKKSKDSDGEAEMNQMFAEALRQSKMESLKIYLAEKINADSYEKDVIEPFNEKVKGDIEKSKQEGLATKVQQKSANSGEGEGDSASVNLKEDWANIAISDTMLSSVVSEHLNNVIATQIMHDALQYISTYDASYLADE